MDIGYNPTPVSLFQMRSEYVRQVQIGLNFLRNEYRFPAWKGLTTDGYYNQETRDAVMAFQKFVGLSPTGNIDNNLIQAMNNLRHDIDCYRRIYRYNYQFPYQERDVFSKRREEQKKDLTFDDYMKEYKNLWAGICADIYSIHDGWYNVTKFSYSGLYDEIKVKLTPKLKELAESMKNTMSGWKYAITSRVKAVMDWVKNLIKKLLVKIRVNPEEISKLPLVNKTKDFVKSNWVGIALAGLPAIYYLYKLMTSDEATAKKEGYEKLFYESLQSFVGAIIVMVFIAAAAGAAWIGGLSAAAIGIIIAVLDVIVVFIFGQGIADYLGQWSASLIGYLEFFAVEAGESIAKYISEKTTKAVNKASNTVYQAKRSVMDYFYDQMMGALQFSHGF